MASCEQKASSECYTVGWEGVAGGIGKDRYKGSLNKKLYKINPQNVDILIFQNLKKNNPLMFKKVNYWYKEAANQKGIVDRTPKSRYYNFEFNFKIFKNQIINFKRPPKAQKVKNWYKGTSNKKYRKLAPPKVDILILITILENSKTKDLINKYPLKFQKSKI